MGYRELLKKYIRFLELNVGDNYIESISSARESELSKRDVAELKTLAAEIYRGAHTAEDVRRIANYNYRLRLLINRYELDVGRAASLAGVHVDQLNRWRTSPRSPDYCAMSSADFERFETALLRFLDTSIEPVGS